PFLAGRRVEDMELAVAASHEGAVTGERRRAVYPALGPECPPQPAIPAEAVHVLVAGTEQYRVAGEARPTDDLAPGLKRPQFLPRHRIDAVDRAAGIADVGPAIADSRSRLEGGGIVFPLQLPRGQVEDVQVPVLGGNVNRAVDDGGGALHGIPGRK